MRDLASIRTFPQLVKYLRDELDWPITSDDFEDLTFDYTPQELGIDSKSAAKIQEIKRLRSLSINQPWGVFFVKFEPKRLPIVALRRILSSVALKRRASANSAERKVWEAEDLLFISNYGEGDGRQITFAHFSQDPLKQDLPTLKVLGWDNLDTPLHLDHVADSLRDHLHWPQHEADVQTWRAEWRQAFGLRYQEVVTTSRALAVRLAGLARAIRNRISMALEIETENGPLTTLMRVFQKALVHDLDADGFADMYAQTIAYGLLSARIANPKANTSDDLAVQMPVTNPFLRELMETFLQVGGRRGETAAGASLDFDELGVSEVVDLLDHANMEAVLRDFGDRNPEEDPVIHFYELFLKEYDPKEKVKRGVFYTPRPVVSYIVRSVHELLQTEFGLPDGLADVATWGEMAHRHKGLTIPEGVKPTDCFVSILDPATGTGTFLVEAIDVIHGTLAEKWKREGHDDEKILDLWNDYVPTHLLPHLHGYELLMAPYAIAHLKIGLKLYETGYRFASDERARIYLTNSLEPPQDFADRLAFAIPALAHEAQAVNKMKREHRFTVVLGNPPYSGHSANKGPWITKKIETYKEGCPELKKPAQAKWLSDDYVKFIRFAQWRIERTGYGILAFITNHSYLDNPTFRCMRQSLLHSFDDIYILDLHGNSKKKEQAPDGTKDENVFDIQQGVAIGLFVRKRGGTNAPHLATVHHADLWGLRGVYGLSEYKQITPLINGKYHWLAERDVANTSWETLDPQAPFFLFKPQNTQNLAEYEAGWKIPDIFRPNGDPAPGIVTTQDEFAISWTKDEAIKKVELLLATETEDDARQLFRLCAQDQWQYAWAKKELADGQWRQETVEVLYRPFDIRWTVFNRNVAVHRRERVMSHMLAGPNLGITIGRAGQVIDQGEWDIVFCTHYITEFNLYRRGGNNLFPLYLYPDASKATLFDAEPHTDALGGRRSNLAQTFTADFSARLSMEFISDGKGDLYNTFGPEDIFHFMYAIFYSPTYRSRYAEFLKIDFPRLPLTSNADLFHALCTLGNRLARLHLMEKYGQATPKFPVPGSDIVEKVDYTLPAHKPEQGRVWINKTQYFERVLPEVWEFHIGGYQVCQKWLKDRKGRVLTTDDIIHYQRIVVALHETIRIMGEIDEVIDAHGGWPNAFLVENIVPMPRQAL